MKEDIHGIAGAHVCSLNTVSERAEDMNLAEFGRAIGHRSRVAMLQALMGAGPCRQVNLPGMPT